MPAALGKRRSGGRHARVKSRQSGGESPYFVPKRKIPVAEIFSEENLDILEHHADWILKEVGIEFRGDPEVLELFREAGADVKGERVRFESGQAKSLCATAPGEFVMHGRESIYDLKVGDGSVGITPGYGSPFVTDNDQGRRYGDRSGLLDSTAGTRHLPGESRRTTARPRFLRVR